MAGFCAAVFLRLLASGSALAQSTTSKDSAAPKKMVITGKASF